MDIEYLLELDSLALESIKEVEKKRFLWETLVISTGRPFSALLGPRGAGKTILLRQLRARTSQGIYISCDTLDRKIDLFELIRTTYESYGITHFFLDEIHSIDQFPGQLKKIYDFLPAHVWITSSSALSLVSSGFDLSRRIEFHSVTPFSFREYLWFLQDEFIPPLSLHDALTKPIPSQILRAGRFFHLFLQGGLYPFMLEPGAKLELFRQMLQKIITMDMPTYDPTLTALDMDTISNIVKFIGTSGIDGISYSSLSRNLGITKYMAQRFVSLLEKSFILKAILPQGTSVTREPKILLQLPYRLLFQDYSNALGAIREEFFALAMEQHSQTYRYAKSTRGAKTPDYVLSMKDETFVLEIGGQGKGRSQFKELEYTKKIILYDTSSSTKTVPKKPIPGVQVPLHVVGFR